MRNTGCLLSLILFTCKYVKITSLRVKLVFNFIIFAVVIYEGSVYSYATELPVISYQTIGVISGTLHDGYHIGKGFVSYDGEHVGFQVWSDAPAISGNGGAYELTGQQNSKNKLRVRLSTDDGWHLAQNGKGIVISTSNDFSKFDVVADGEQKPNADYYSLEFKSVALLP